MTTPQPLRAERRIPIGPFRRVTARAVKEIQNDAAILTTFNDIDMTAVLALRERHGKSFEKRHGIPPSITGWFVVACAKALPRFDALNARLDGEEIVYRRYHDVAISVDTAMGVVLPVIRDADRLGYAEVERRLADLAARAREGLLGVGEIGGATFTIHDHSDTGALLSTQLLGQAQSGALALHKIEHRPAVMAGRLITRPMMYVSLSYDHRLIDGAGAVQFLRTVKDVIEDPERLLIDI